ncbi:MAG TPA: DUF1080 domain-containing protein [Roseivirga sp.]
MKKVSVILAVILLSSCAGQKSDWKSLFNGQDLEGWTVMGSDATFEIDNGTVIGTNQGRQNTFLATNDVYSDFILELDVWVDPSMNSGLQFRSAQHENGRVYGYQAEIDPSERAYSGGIYDEARRDWLYPLSLNQQASTAFKINDWNKYRIVAIGNTIRIWVNGICTAVMEDDASAEGFIALQVHGVGLEEDEGRQAKWRNVRVATENLEEKLWPLPADIYVMNLLTNELSDMEKEQGWELIWNGQDMEGWKTTDEATVWSIQDGALTVGSGEGHLMSEEVFENYELSLLYQLTEGAEGGIGYQVNEGDGNFDAFSGQEFQIADHAHLEADNASHKQGALYGKIAPTNLSWVGMGERHYKRLGIWNHVRIIVKDGQVEHWLNGFKLVAYSLPDHQPGAILLQNQGPGVHYKSLRIKRT